MDSKTCFTPSNVISHEKSSTLNVSLISEHLRNLFHSDNLELEPDVRGLLGPGARRAEDLGARGRARGPRVQGAPGGVAQGALKIKQDFLMEIFCTKRFFKRKLVLEAKLILIRTEGKLS